MHAFAAPSRKKIVWKPSIITRPDSLGLKITLTILAAGFEAEVSFRSLSTKHCMNLWAGYISPGVMVKWRTVSSVWTPLFIFECGVEVSMKKNICSPDGASRSVLLRNGKQLGTPTWKALYNEESYSSKPIKLYDHYSTVNQLIIIH